MEAVILAGGLGTRLRERVPDCPKAMAPVAGRPFMEILLTSLARNGVTRAVLSLGYMASVIVAHFGTRFAGIELKHQIEDQPLGTGGALKVAMTRCTDAAALVVNGDTMLDFDARAAMQQWATRQHPVILAKEVEDTARFGRLVLDGNRVVGFAEKGVSGRGVINTGHYVLPTDLFSGHALQENFSFEVDFLSEQILQTRFDAYLTDGTFIDIGVPVDYEIAQTLFANRG